MSFEHSKKFLEEIWAEVFTGKTAEPTAVAVDLQKERYDGFFQFDRFSSGPSLLGNVGLHRILNKIFPISLADSQIDYVGYIIEDIKRTIEDCNNIHLSFGKKMSLKLNLSGQVDVRITDRFNNSLYKVRYKSAGRDFDVIPTMTEEGMFLISSGRLNPPIRRCPVYGIRIIDEKGPSAEIYDLSNAEVKFLSDYIEARIERVLLSLKKRMSTLKGSEITPKHAYIIAGQLSRCIYQCLTNQHVCPPLNDVNPVSAFSHKRELSHIGPFGLKGKRSQVDRRHIHHTHYGRLCPLETPESEAIGLTLHLARGASISGTGEFLAKYRPLSLLPVSMEIGKYLGSYTDNSPSGGSEEVLSRHDEMIEPIQAEKLIYRDRLPGQFLGYGASLIPFIQHNDPTRALMGSKNIKQAVVLKHPEKPLIITGVEKEINEDFGIGRNFLVAYMPWYGYNYEDGIVVSDKILDLFISKKEYTPIVVPVWGDERTYNRDHGKVRKNGFLTDNGLVPENFPVVPGQPVVRLHKLVEFLDEAIVRDEYREGKIPLYVTGKIASIVQEQFHPENKVLSPGTLKGLIKIYVTDERKLQVGDKLMGRHGNKGVVSKILPAAEMPYFLDEAEGMTDQMNSSYYHREDRRHTHVEIILNPHGVISRMNLGQLMETHMGLVIKRAPEETRKYFDKEWLPFEKVDMGQLRDGLRQTLVVNDRGRTKLKFLIEDKIVETQSEVVVGYQYIMKLDHMVEDKYHARNTGGNATVTGQPVKGRGKGGGMRFGNMEVWALEANGADAILRELVSDNSDDPKREGYARSLKALVIYFRGLGLSLEFLDKKGDTVQVPRGAVNVEIKFADDKLAIGWSRGKVTSIARPRVETKQGKEARAIFDEKGLFSAKVFGKEEVSRFWKKTGSVNDNMYMGHIPLAEPILNPVFSAIVDSKLSREIFGDELPIDKSDPILEMLLKLIKPVRVTWSKKKGFTKQGKNMLVTKIHGHTSIFSGKKDIREGSVITVNEYADVFSNVEAFDLWGLCKNPGLAQKFGLSSEIIKRLKRFFINNIPVIPISLRPYLYDGGSHKFILGDLNTLYKNVIYANNRLNAAKANDRVPKKAAEEYRAKEFLELETNKLFVFGDRVEKLKSISGLLSGKEGLIRHSLLGKRCNYSGRSVIVPDPYIQMDQAIIPWEIAIVLFERNKQIFDAIKSMKDGERKELQDQCIILSRAPSLHKYNVQAFRPVVEKGIRAIKINPAICQGYNADFDGDQMSIFVLNNAESKKEAFQMLLPQQNLISLANGGFVPSLSLDIKLGLYLMFQCDQGRRSLESDLGSDISPGNIETKLVGYVHNNDPEKARVLIERLLREAFEYATISGISFGMFDLQDLDVSGDSVKKALAIYLDKYGYQNLSRDTMSMSEIKEYEETVQMVNDCIKIKLGIYDEKELNDLSKSKRSHLLEFRGSGEGTFKKHSDNAVAIIYSSGAKRDDKQIMQIVGIKGFLEYPLFRASFPPVRNSYLKGLHPFEYFISTFQSRSSLMDKKLKTGPSGYLTRKLISAAYELVISKKDCKSTEGLIVMLKHDARFNKNCRWLIGRTLAEDVKIGTETYTRDFSITHELFQLLKVMKITSLKVRSPLYCDSKNGICQLCYGSDLSTRGLPVIGKRVGIIAGQSVGERLTQLSMRSYHTGTAAGIIKDFDVIDNGFDGTERKLEESKRKLFCHEDLPKLLDLYDYKVDSRHFEVILKSTGNGKVRISDVSLNQNDFLSAASFGYSTEILAKAACKKKTVKVSGLMDKLLLGQWKEGKSYGR